MPIRYEAGEQTFTLPCFRTLVKSLGEFDSLVEYQELASRMLLASFDPSKESFSDYLKRQSKNHGINLNDITPQDYKISQIQGYLVFPCACFDAFLTGYDDEVKLLINSEYTLNGLKGSHLKKATDALKNISVTLNINPDELDLYDYYRELRNDLAHNLDNEYTKRYDAINKTAIQSIYPKLQAPNEKSSLCFDDFILCTANIKSVALQMTSSLLPYVDWAVRAAQNRDVWFPNYGRYSEKRDKERRKKCVYNSLLTRYGLRLSDYDLETIVDTLAHSN